MPRAPRVRITCLRMRDREVRLSDSGIADKKQPALDHGKLFGHLARAAQRIFRAFVVVSDEIVERAVVIAAGNARLGDEPLVDVVAPAVAARDALDLTILERLPTGTVADGTDGFALRRRKHAT